MGQKAVGRWQRWRRVAGVIRSLVNATDFQIGCARILHETLLVPVLTYGSKTMLWKEKKRSRIRAAQINDFRGLLGIRRIDRISNAQIMELCGVTKGINERINEGVLRWFGHVERMEKDSIAKRVYVGECAGIRLVDRHRNR